MIYTQLGNNTQGLEYRDDPLAKTIAPDYEKLSMSAWGIPQLDDLDKFAPKMEENLDTTPNEFSQYINNFQDLTSTAQKFLKLGVDITKPSLNPEENAAHLEWLDKYNANIELGKKLQQSRREKEKYNTMLGKPGVWTNPLDESKMVTSLDDLAYAPDFDTFEKAILAKSKRREQLFNAGQVDLANAELDDIKRQIDTYVNQVPPAFKAQAMQRAENLKSVLPQTIEDLQAQDKSRLAWARLNETSAYHKGILDLARQKFGWQQSQSQPIEFDTESLIRKAGTGDQQAIDLINRYYGYNAKGESTGGTLIVSKGEDLTIKRLKQPDGSYIEVNPNQNYFIRVDGTTGKKYVTPVNETSIKSFTQGVIGKVVEAGTSKNKTSNLWSEEETEVTDIPIGTKKTNTNSGKSSTTSVVKNKTIVRTGTANGKKVVQYSDGTIEYQ